MYYRAFIIAIPLPYMFVKPCRIFCTNKHIAKISELTVTSCLSFTRHVL